MRLGSPRNGNGGVGPPGDTTRLRVLVERLAPRPGCEARIGLVSMGGEGYSARFLDVTTSRLP